MTRVYLNKQRLEQEIAKKTCYGKVKHKSRLAAEYYLNSMNGIHSNLLGIYICPFCSFSHIGHNINNK